jgi:hypothetical protein
MVACPALLSFQRPIYPAGIRLVFRWPPSLIEITRTRDRVSASNPFTPEIVRRRALRL